MFALLTFYAVWEPTFDDPILARVIPSIISVLAVAESIAGVIYMKRVGGSNQSSYVLGVLYANAKVVSVFIMVYGAERLLLGEGTTPAVAIAAVSILLACLQVIKIVSAGTAAVRYLKGRPDEDLPGSEEVCQLGCFAALGLL